MSEWPVLDKFVARICAEVGQEDWELVKARLVEIVGETAQKLSVDSLKARYGPTAVKKGSLKPPTEFPGVAELGDEYDGPFIEVPGNLYCVADMPSIEELLGESAMATRTGDPYKRTRRERSKIDYCGNTGL